MSLQIKRGNGAPSTLLKAGEQYLDTTTGYLYIGDGTVNKIYVDKTEVETLIAAASTGSGSSGGLDGSYFSVVDASGTPAENGVALLAEYARVKALGLILDADTRFTIYIPAGLYDLASELTVDTAYIDVTSLNGEKSVYLTGNTINVTVDHVWVTGIDVGTQEFKGCNNLANIVITNCKGGNSSFGGNGGIASGTFVNCTGDMLSFGGNSASTSGTASGTFKSCFGGAYSFGTGGTASGTFENCTGGSRAFGGYNTASGTFINCTGGSDSFGMYGIPSGKFLWCRVTAGSFPTPATGGKQRMCLNADYSEVNAG